MNKEKNTKKSIGDDLSRLFGLDEFSRVTGVRLELLRRYINRQARQARSETWDKITPALRELIEDDPKPTGPRRIGPPYRRHNELVEMVSDQKVLLDGFTVLEPQEQQKVLKEWRALADAKPTEYTSLTPAENTLMGIFLALSPEQQQSELLKLLETAKTSIRRQRKNA